MTVRIRDHVPKFLAAMKVAEVAVLEQMGKRITKRIDEGFDTGRDALGRKWAPLSDETIRRKTHAQILVDTSEMRNSITYEVDRGRGQLHIGPSDPLSAQKLDYHEYGVPERNLPARPVMEPAAIWTNQHLGPLMLGSVKDTLSKALF